MLAVGDVIASKYRVDRILGTGGMGVVVAATHVRLQQPVALKFLLPAHVANPEAVERFAREARASAQLRNEHVCRVSDVDAFADGSPYIVMELLDGLDLASILKRTGPLPVATACNYALEACLGVAEAHALGIVHRDLKPANLFLTKRPDGRPLIKVLDFGIAKASSDRGFDLTQTSVVLGSPGYMSPEQLRSSRQVDPRSDIWGIGVILYELVSGRPPFTGATITELALRIAMDPPPPLHTTPPEFEAVVARCLAKEPDDRYADLARLARALVPFADDGASELANSVEQMLRHRGAPPPPVLPVAAPVPPTAPMTASDLRLLPTQLPAQTSPTTLGSAASSSISTPTSRRWGYFAGAVAIALVAVLALVIASSRARNDASSPAPAAAPVAPPVTSRPIVEPIVDAPVIRAAPDAAIPDTATPDAAAPDAPKRPARPQHVPTPVPEDLGESRI
jgi:serine/threonine protein kinase